MSKSQKKQGLLKQSSTTKIKRHRQHPKKIIKTTHPTVVRDNKGAKKKKKNTAEIACRQVLLKQSGMAAACKYLWSCHGIHPQLRILFKQPLSEHWEPDRHCIITAPMRALVTTKHTRQTEGARPSRAKNTGPFWSATRTETGSEDAEIQVWAWMVGSNGAAKVGQAGRRDQMSPFCFSTLIQSEQMVDQNRAWCWFC